MRPFASLALILAIAIPYGQSWLGFCAMAKAGESAAHACPHHRPQDAAAKEHCHSQPQDSRASSMVCNCGSSGHDSAAAAAVFDRFGLVVVQKRNHPNLLAGILHPGPSLAPEGGFPEPPTPPPRLSS